MTKEASSSDDPPRFDLEERTAVFGERVIDMAKRVPRNVVRDSIVRQLVRASTSVGANYGEASDAETRKDFRHKIGLCRKEAREAKHWLRMLVRADESFRDEARLLWQEAKELNLIFSAIVRKTAE